MSNLDEVQKVPGSSSSDTEAKYISVFHQLRNFRLQIPKDLLAKWEKPGGVGSLILIVKDWAVILAAHQLYLRKPSVLTFLIAVLMMAWGQRGLSNLSHDSIHGNLVDSRRANDVLANVFLAPALMSTASIQRQSHSAHHHYLGTENDPDHGIHNATSLKHYRNGRFEHKTILSLFLYDVFDPVIFIQNAFGSLNETPIYLIWWWTVVTLLSSILETNESGDASFELRFTFVILYHTARCTLSYLVYVLREVVDHSGLPATSILSFTRTSPCCNAVQKFLQPHDDNYHLLHHLLPRIPMTNLHEAHLWLLDHCADYAMANQYDSYLIGTTPLFAQPIHMEKALSH